MNFTSFSHGQITSKLWLCEKLEPYVPEHSKIKILGSWYNTMAFLLLIRKPNYYQLIEGFDVDTNVKAIADKICDAWIVNENLVKNHTASAESVQYEDKDVVINCSPEHMDNSEWFNKIPKSTLVCIQSSNVVDSNEPWLIKTPHYNFSDFLKKYPLEQTYYSGSKTIQYSNWGYDRYMIIGVK